MLVVRDQISDDYIRNFAAFLREGDVVVFNDTRVIPARLIGVKGEGRVEILLHKCHDGSHTHQDWWVFAKPAKKLKPENIIQFSDDFFATVLEKREDGQVLLRFEYSSNAFNARLAEHGQMPLPPYIQKQREAASEDIERYQTVYAAHSGSVAAPTAGLHFTSELLKAIDDAGAIRTHVTLHVGGGTFLPVKVDDTADHQMHSEYAILSEETAAIINDAKAKGNRIIAIGTTSMRTLESACKEGTVHAFADDTSIFITPGYVFGCVDVLLTNFHLPKSTLFMLVSAFSGLEQMQAAYRHAIAEKYRFYSYGDACLLYRQNR